MKVSVLIPVYNRRQYIADAIQSVLAQDYDDLEIIVVDDGSTDNLEEVLAPFSSLIRYIKTENQGVAAARNVGMQTARGEYIAYLDSDDLYYPFKVRLQVQLLDEKPDIGMVYSEFSAFSDDGFWDEFHLHQYHASAYQRGGVHYKHLFSDQQPLHDTAYYQRSTNPDLTKWAEKIIYYGDIYEAYLFNTIVFTNSMMFRRTLLQTIGLQQKKFGMFHDLEFALRICKDSKVAFIDIPTYKLRYHPEQISTTQKQKGELVAIKIQRNLLRVTKYHAKNNSEFYDQNKQKVNRQLARLCRAVAIPLLSFSSGSSHANKYFPKRARRYLAKCAEYGQSEWLLSLLSFTPHVVRRIAFKLMAIKNSLQTRIQNTRS